MDARKYKKTRNGCLSSCWRGSSNGSEKQPKAAGDAAATGAGTDLKRQGTPQKQEQ
ncbi:hypothetical protein [Prevotella sp. P4-98]|uniref:hypothetical protein n=1 Tax=Prevotella sp. P4-98 TaxID=2024219 RepID=UPI0013038397|nr:hypothetical protein [Prevotella sp. P4-98]